jgi:hypothetical protein
LLRWWFMDVAPALGFNWRPELYPVGGGVRRHRLGVVRVVGIRM